MSRSLVRLLAAAALVASPAVVQAQNTCTVTLGNCAVNFGAQVVVPVLASLDVATTGTLALPTPNWTSFLNSPAPTTLAAQTSFTVKSNSQYTVGISTTGWVYTGSQSGSRATSSIRWAVDPTTCPAVGGISGNVATGTLVPAGTPTGGATNLLCFALDYPGNLNDPSLRPGTYDLPVVLTITAP